MLQTRATSHEVRSKFVGFSLMEGKQIVSRQSVRSNAKTFARNYFGSKDATDWKSREREISPDVGIVGIND